MAGVPFKIVILTDKFNKYLKFQVDRDKIQKLKSVSSNSQRQSHKTIELYSPFIGNYDASKVANPPNNKQEQQRIDA